MVIRLKRIYDPVGPKDGKRVFIDRLWPRGISKQQATWDEWMKDAAPSTELRKWFAHNEERFELFRERYLEELMVDPKKHEAVKHLLQVLAKGNLTLLYSAKSETCNHALVLRDFLQKQL